MHIPEGIDTHEKKAMGTYEQVIFDATEGWVKAEDCSHYDLDLFT